MSTSTFKVGDKVKWTNQGPKSARSHEGEVVEVVPPGKRPDKDKFALWQKGKQTGTRYGESYLILDSKGKYQWPLADRLVISTSPPAPTASVTAPAPVAAMAPPTLTSKSRTKSINPDGSITTVTVTTIQVGSNKTTTTETETKIANPDLSLTTITETVIFTGGATEDVRRLKVTTTTQLDGSTSEITEEEVFTRPVQAAPPAAAEKETDFVILLDSSGSMGGIKDATIKAFNQLVEDIKVESAKVGLKTPRVTLYTFGESGHPTLQKYFRQPVDTLMALDGATYRPAGNTPLYACIEEAIEAIMANSDIANSKDNAVVINVITDGENNMPERTVGGTAKALQRVTATGRFTVAVMVPRGRKDGLLREFGRYGIQAGNVTEWDATAKGVAQASIVNTSSVMSFMGARSMGVTSVDNYYVQPDLSKLTVQDLTNLDDLSGIYRVYNVDQEARIDEFVYGRTGKDYVIGSAFYQLTKNERRVQPGKGILLRDKYTKKIYGGAQARRLIGLPDGINATVEPGNHAQFDIFVESTSVNRLLPRGSMVLHDFRMTTSKTPTWVAKTSP